MIREVESHCQETAELGIEARSVSYNWDSILRSRTSRNGRAEDPDHHHHPPPRPPAVVVHPGEGRTLEGAVREQEAQDNAATRVESRKVLVSPEAAVALIFLGIPSCAERGSEPGLGIAPGLGEQLKAPTDSTLLPLHPAPKANVGGAKTEARKGLAWFPPPSIVPGELGGTSSQSGRRM